MRCTPSMLAVSLVIAAMAVNGGPSLAAQSSSQVTSFRVRVSDELLKDLARRLDAARFPSPPTWSRRSAKTKRGSASSSSHRASGSRYVCDSLRF
jgi:hypothetical protein